MLDAVGGRKFIAMLVLSILGALIECVAPNGLTTEMKIFLGSMGTMYVGGNVVMAKIHKEPQAKQSLPVKEIELLAKEQSESSAIIKDLKAVIDSKTDDAGEGIQILSDIHKTLEGLVQAQGNTQKLIVAALGRGVSQNISETG